MFTGRLSDKSAAEALALISDGWHIWEIASHFGITPKAAYDLAKGNTHKRVPGRRLGRQYGLMTLWKARYALRLAHSGHSLPYIASKLDVGLTTVKRALSGNWRPIWAKRSRDKRVKCHKK